MRAVILVDESGSLSGSDVEDEKQAALILALGALNSESEVAVVGFGSSNGAGQSAVDQVCPLTRVEPARQQFLIACIDQLHRRDESEGADTDHVAALNQALSILDVPDSDDRAKLVFLLTDGRLDVVNSPQYGGQPSARNANAQLLLDEAVGEARTAGVQLWPLGFGAADRAALDRFAAGGARQTCNNRQENQPTARLVPPGDTGSVVARTLFEAIGSANCAETTDFDTGDLAPGSQSELTVAIPEISTDGVIVVLKGDARVRVTYVDPNGTTITGSGTFDGSTFTASPTTGVVETLRIENPRPGNWTVRLSAGPEVPAQQVAAAAMWQGVIQVIINLTPSSPQAGTTAAVSVRLQTRTGAINDPASLNGISFAVRMSGEDIEPQVIPVVDDGQDPDRQAGDGEYSGLASIPRSATGTLDFVGTVSGAGVVSASSRLSTTISAGLPPVTGMISLNGGNVRPGEQVRGRLVVDNNDNQPRTLALLVRDVDSGTRTEPTPRNIETRQLGRVEADFALVFASDSAEGPASGRVLLVDAADPNVVYASAFFSVEVAVPAAWWIRLWWVWLLLAAAAVVAAYFVYRARRALATATSIDGVTVVLRRGNALYRQLQAPDGAGRFFRFVINGGTTENPQLDHAHGAADAYTVTRDRHGMVSVRTPDGDDHELSVSIPVTVESGLSLTYREPERPVVEEDGSVRLARRGDEDPYTQPGFETRRGSDDPYGSVDAFSDDLEGNRTVPKSGSPPPPPPPPPPASPPAEPTPTPRTERRDSGRTRNDQLFDF